MDEAGVRRQEIRTNLVGDLYLPTTTERVPGIILLGGSDGEPMKEPGFTVVELGCGSGPFTIALAQMVGSSGRVIAADVQPAMLAKVQKRVMQAGVQDRVELHLCGREHVGLSTHIDFVLAFWMVHEVPNAVALFAEMHEALNPDGKLLLVEPKLHVGRRDFEKEVDAALEANLKLLARPSVRLSHATLFAKGS